jgi:hypothetical protein
MEKYLFTDGTNVNREVESKEELQRLIQSAADPAKIRIWIFNTNEWISLADFNKRSPLFSPSEKKIVSVEIEKKPKPVKKFAIPGVLKKVLFGILTVAAIFLVYNFTRVTWRKTFPMHIVAERPANTPVSDIDSLIATIELLRGQKLDKTTRTNLRIRNNWPDLLQLHLDADRDTSREGLRYYNLTLSIDNSTGYSIDEAEVKLVVWENNMPAYSDTMKFDHIGYSTPARRSLAGVHKGDSISVAFSSIRSRAFNFCYSSDKKTNYGNYNDRWFCR